MTEAKVAGKPEIPPPEYSQAIASPSVAGDVANRSAFLGSADCIVVEKDGMIRTVTTSASALSLTIEGAITPVLKALPAQLAGCKALSDQQVVAIYTTFTLPDGQLPAIFDHKTARTFAAVAMEQLSKSSAALININLIFHKIAGGHVSTAATNLARFAKSDDWSLEFTKV